MNIHNQHPESSGTAMPAGVSSAAPETRMIQGLVDGSMDAIISIDSERCVILFNLAATRIFGVQREDAIGRPIDQFIPERFREAHSGHLKTFGERKRSSRAMGQGAEIVGVRANGEEFPAEASISHFEIDGQRLFTVFLRDITEQVKTAQALERSLKDLELNQAILERTAAMAKVGGWELDLATTVLTLSQEAARIHEVEQPYEPLKFSQGQEYYPAQTWPIVQAAVNNATQFGTPYDLELPFITAKGRQIWIRVQGFAVQENGKTVKLEGTIQDITERIRAEEQQRAVVDRLALATRAGGIGIWDFDVVNNALVWDDAMYGLYGIASGQCGDAYETWRSGVHPDDQMRGDAEIQAALRGEQDFDTEFRVLWPNGEVRNIRALATVQRDSSGEPVRIVGTNWDITDQKENETALRDSVNEREALLKEVHHRVKNNLQVITSLLRLEARRSKVPQAVDVLKDMQGRIHSMALLHESLYRAGTFASIDLGVYLGLIARQAYQTQLHDGMAVPLKLNMGSLAVGMDQAMACGLLVNELVANSLKHAFKEDASMSRAGQVCVALQPANTATVQTDSLWRLQVTDTGVGLPDDFEERRKTSLGLQLVGDLSRQVGGTLRIESQPGAGADFAVVFKALAPAALIMPE